MLVLQGTIPTNQSNRHQLRQWYGTVPYHTIPRSTSTPCASGTIPPYHTNQLEKAPIICLPRTMIMEIHIHTWDAPDPCRLPRDVSVRSQVIPLSRQVLRLACCTSQRRCSVGGQTSRESSSPPSAFIVIFLQSESHLS